MIYQSTADQSWHAILKESLAQMDQDYLQTLSEQQDWLPGPEKIFNAFSLPLDKTKYILFGESPYPRAQSANGYAFWDQAVGSLWSETGLSKTVNRATSLRNFIKMLLIANGLLKPTDCSQPAIQALEKAMLVQTGHDLFTNLLDHGFLLLNTSLVLSDRSVPKESKYWLPFINKLLELVYLAKPDMTLILWGNIAKKIEKIDSSHQFKQLQAEHPYNISFISNRQMIDFFAPFNLLGADHVTAV